MITHNGKEFHVIAEHNDLIYAYREGAFRNIVLFKKAFGKVEMFTFHIEDLKAVVNHYDQQKFDSLCDDIAENMTDYAQDHWEDFAYEDCFAGVDEETELENAYSRVNGKDLEDSQYDKFLKSSIIQKGISDMNDIILEKMRTVKQPPQTMQDKLREVGMSERDFI